MVGTSPEPSEQSDRAALTEARQLLDEGMLENALKLVKDFWLANPSDSDAVCLFADIMEAADRSQPATKVRALGEHLRDNDGSPTNVDTDGYCLFEAGFALVDLRQYELGSMLLQQCHRLMPDEPVVSYELAFALMSLNRFQEAIPYFQRAKVHLPDFDTNLNLSVCYAMTRDLSSARRSIDDLAKLDLADDERKELAHRRIVLRRIEELRSKAALSQRDWLYALYGTMLLRPGSSTQANADHKTIASTVLILRGVLEGLRMEFDGIEYYNPVSKPLAQLVAELFELPLDSYRGPDRPDRALLVMAWATDVIGPHNSFIENSDKRCIFAYGLSVDEPLPVMPDIVAYLSSESPMPWDNQSKSEKTDRIVAAILEKARDLEADPNILRLIQEAVEYYDLKRQLMVALNPQAFSDRPEYTAETPSPA